MNEWDITDLQFPFPGLTYVPGTRSWADLSPDEQRQFMASIEESIAPILRKLEAAAIK